MPFVYELMLAEETPQPEYTLVQQLAAAGTLVGTGQKIAVLAADGAEFNLKAPLQGLLVEWLFASGEPLDVDAPVARIVAESAPRPVDAVTPERSRPC
jgi:pyruvate/2-oxoglutarate dehydrogenase complex dihydrolipoamide acyltransferase (E2) component